MDQIEIFAVPGLPEVHPGDDLATLIAVACETAGMQLHAGDVVAVTQKIVSKAEDRIVFLEDIIPSSEAESLARAAEKDPRLVELMLRESNRALRWRPGAIVLEHRLGFVCANAGIDRSNVEQDRVGMNQVLLLPEDPDLSALLIRERLAELLHVSVAVLIIDSQGRPFRNGAIGVAIGVAGMRPLTNMIGWTDRFGYSLHSTVMATADELAAAASLLMGQADEGRPVVVVRGAPYEQGEGAARELLRTPETDMFR